MRGCLFGERVVPGPFVNILYFLTKAFAVAVRLGYTVVHSFSSLPPKTRLLGLDRPAGPWISLDSKLFETDPPTRSYFRLFHSQLVLWSLSYLKQGLPPSHHTSHHYALFDVYKVFTWTQPGTDLTALLRLGVIFGSSLFCFTLTCLYRLLFNPPLGHWVISRFFKRVGAVSDTCGERSDLLAACPRETVIGLRPIS